MNNRIQQLAEQAGAVYSNDHAVSLLDDEIEKFAELIVRECMKLNSKELSITAIERLLPLYKEQFGVEE